jgi:hypothetical protein
VISNGELRIYDSTFESNTAFFVSNSEAVLRKFPDFSAQFLGGPHGTIPNDRRFLNLLGLSQLLAQNVSLIISFHLHYFSSPSNQFLPKELSQNFAPIPRMQLLGWSYFC